MDIKKKRLEEYRRVLKEQQDSMVMQFLPALRAMAYRLKERLPSSVDVNDLISVGAEEMIKLSRRYDKEINDSFWGYAKKRVYGSMLDFLRSLDVVSRSSRKLIKAIDSEIQVYFDEHGIEPDDEYLAHRLDESIQKIKEARAASQIVYALPLDEQLVVYADKSTEEKIEKEDLIEHIKRVLSLFSQREQIIVQLYYFEELNLKEISSILRISESRISQIHKRLIGKIRERLCEA